MYLNEHELRIDGLEVNLSMIINMLRWVNLELIHCDKVEDFRYRGGKLCETTDERSRGHHHNRLGIVSSGSWIGSLICNHTCFDPPSSSPPFGSHIQTCPLNFQHITDGWKVIKPWLPKIWWDTIVKKTIQEEYLTGIIGDCVDVPSVCVTTIVITIPGVCVWEFIWKHEHPWLTTLSLSNPCLSQKFPPQSLLNGIESLTSPFTPF